MHSSFIAVTLATNHLQPTKTNTGDIVIGSASFREFG
jgi:hypothetical protein